MADVYEYLTLSGTIVPDTADIQAEVQQEYKTAFGSDLVVTPDTPQGALITGEVLARKAVADNNATLANQINPNLAGGIFLAAIMALTGTAPTPAEHTIVSGNLAGVAGTIIPQGSQARDVVTGEIFESQLQVTLSSGGTATVDFAAINPGPIAVAANNLTQIITGTLGWETVTNPAAQTTLGAASQSDAEARLFRRNTLAAQGSSLAEAILSAVYLVPSVLSAVFRENVSNSTQVIDGVTMVAKSIYLCVDGGTDIDVTNAIVSKKSGGAAYNNGASSHPISEVIVVPFSNQSMTIKFDRPDLIPVLVRVTVKTNSAIIDPIAAVKQAILDYATGKLEGEAGLTVGTSVSCFELGGAVNQEIPQLFVQNVEISLASPISYSNAGIPIAIFEKATIQASSITVVLV